MIEFKAECGHTVRAKDADAGSVVRCSYCGHETTVPGSEDTSLDFMFHELSGQDVGGTVVRTRRRRKRRGTWLSRLRLSRSFNPFGIILRMCYLALLISIVWIVGSKYVVPMFTDVWTPPPEKATTASEPEAEAGTERAQRSGTPRFGLIQAGDRTGLYVASTPPGALFFCVESGQAPSEGRIHTVRGGARGRANGERLRLSDGTYVVEVVLAWNDPSLTDPRLPYADRYRQFRREIEQAADEKRKRLLDAFFLPDEADVTFVSQTEEQIYLVRQYWDVEVRHGKSRGVRALFLPRITLPGRDAFSIAELVAYYIPKERKYAFDEAWVRNELDYFNVPESERLFVIETLSRIGVIPYATPTGRTLLFKIDIDDGMLTMKDLKEQTTNGE